MSYAFFADSWSKNFIEYFMKHIASQCTARFTMFQPDIVREPITEVDALKINGWEFDVEEVGRYDLAVHEHDSPLFNSMVPGRAAMEPVDRLRCYLHSVAMRVRHHLRGHKSTALVVFQPIKADRIIATIAAREMGVPVISINPEPFPGFYWLDNGAPQHTGFLSTIENWHRIRRAQFTEADDTRFDSWAAGFFEGKQTRGADWLDDSGTPCEIGPEGVLIIGQMRTDANQFMYQRGIPYRPDLIAHRICDFDPGQTVYYKPHPLERNQDAIDFNNPRVVVLPPKSNLHDYLSSPRIDHVITWNSNAGIEALAHHKKLVVLGEAFYRGKGFTYDIGTMEELNHGSLGGAYLWSPDHDEIDQYLKFMVCRYLVPSDDPHAICARMNDLVFGEPWLGI